jgi:hypothetical protein
MKMFFLIFLLSSPAWCRPYNCDVGFGKLVPVHLSNPAIEINPDFGDTPETQIHKLKDIQVGDRVLQTRYADYKGEQLSNAKFTLNLNCQNSQCVVDLPQLRAATIVPLHDQRLKGNHLFAEIMAPPHSKNRILVRVFKEKVPAGANKSVPASSSAEIAFENELPYIEINAGADEQFDLGNGQTARIEAAEAKIICRPVTN